ncbi:hypothetical protein D3C72_1939700 [compost metagenome]
MPARRASAAVIKAQKRGEDFLPRQLRYTRPVILDVHATTLLAHLITDGHPGVRVAHGIGDQVLDRPVQVARFGFDPGVITVGGRQA